MAIGGGIEQSQNNPVLVRAKVIEFFIYEANTRINEITFHLT